MQEDCYEGLVMEVEHYERFTWRQVVTGLGLETCRES